MENESIFTYLAREEQAATQLERIRKGSLDAQVKEMLFKSIEQKIGNHYTLSRDQVSERIMNEFHRAGRMLTEDQTELALEHFINYTISLNASANRQYTHAITLSYPGSEDYDGYLSAAMDTLRLAETTIQQGDAIRRGEKAPFWLPWKDTVKNFRKIRRNLCFAMEVPEIHEVFEEMDSKFKKAVGRGAYKKAAELKKKMETALNVERWHPLTTESSKS